MVTSGTSNRHGAEVKFNSSIADNVYWRNSATWTVAEDSTNTSVTRRPKWLGLTAVDWTMDKWTNTAEYLYTGEHLDIDSANRAWPAANFELGAQGDWNDDKYKYTAEDIRLWAECEAHKKAEHERELEILWLGKGGGKGGREGKAKGKGKGAAGKTGKGAGTS